MILHNKIIQNDNWIFIISTYVTVIRYTGIYNEFNEFTVIYILLWNIVGYIPQFHLDYFSLDWGPGSIYDDMGLKQLMIPGMHV